MVCIETDIDTSNVFVMRRMNALECLEEMCMVDDVDPIERLEVECKQYDLPMMFATKVNFGSIEAIQFAQAMLCTLAVASLPPPSEEAASIKQ